jgi:hypothetical protein
VRFAVEAWDPTYGSSSDEAVLERGETPVDAAVEVAEEDWRPRHPPSGTRVASSVLFVDGVLRVEARVWVGNGGAPVAVPGLCGSYAAGAVRCGDTADVVAVDVRRGLFSSSSAIETIQIAGGDFEPRATAADGFDQLHVGLQQRMRELEVEVARRVEGEAELVVVDGPLTDRRGIADAIGYVKSHHVGYLPDSVVGVVGELEAGERTPLFLATTKWSRYSWYLRLPGERTHAWSGIVRCEASADHPVDRVVDLADRMTVTLPRYASTPHKDPRSPQNLFPIAGLERELRRRLGDPALMLRALRQAAARSR